MVPLSKMSDPVWTIFGKYPQKGFSKTRLARDLDEESALLLYHAFIEDFFEGLARYQKSKQDVIQLWPTPFNQKVKNYFEDLSLKVNLTGELEYHPQDEKLTFFERLKAILNANKGRTVLLTGTDIPNFPFHYLNAPSPKKDEVIIGPDRDGGFYFMAVNGEHADLFNINPDLMSSGQLMTILKNRIRQLNLKLTLLSPWSDIDTLEDLKLQLQSPENMEKTTIVAKTLGIGIETF